MSISHLCRIMDVSRSGYYDWLGRPLSTRQQEDHQLIVLLKKLFEQHRGVVGTRRLRYLLKRHGESLSRKRIARLMKLANLSCQHKRTFKVTTDSNHGLAVAPHLLARQFHVAAPNRYWVGDITYVPTQEGWLYLSTVMDLYSRKIVGWSMADHMRAELVNDALTMALWRRKPGKGLIWHSDQGSQYCAASHRSILNDHGMIQSMSRKGNCWDNALAESFFNTIKTELIHNKIFKTKQEANMTSLSILKSFITESASIQPINISLQLILKQLNKN